MLSYIGTVQERGRDPTAQERGKAQVMVPPVWDRTVLYEEMGTRWVKRHTAEEPEGSSGCGEYGNSVPKSRPRWGGGPSRRKSTQRVMQARNLGEAGGSRGV